MASNTEGYQLSRGLIELNIGALTLTNIEVINLNILQQSVIKINNGAGIVNIIGSKFKNIEREGSDGKGGVIEGYIGNNNGKISVSSSSTFENCKVDTNNGLGGGIYLKISNGGELKYDLSGASYSECNAKYGKSLFIDGFDLKLIIPIGSQAKLGTLSDSIELSQVEQMMGYDNDNENLVIPLIYVYSSISNSIYHVSSTNSNPQGNDNKFCGHLQWPCLTINYAIEQSGSASEKKVGIISEYQLNSIVDLNLEGIQIQRQINAVTWASTSDNSIILIKPQGQLSISSGTILFNEITFKVESGINQQLKYAIEGISGASQIELTKCLMIMASNTEGYQLSRGLIELNIGALTLTNIEVINLNILQQSVIKINNGAGIVNIIGSKFKNIEREGSDGKGGVIEGYIGNNNGKISVSSSSTFENCKVDTNNGLGGGIYLKISNGGELKYDLSGASYSECNAKYGKSLFIDGFDLKLIIPIGSQAKLGTLSDSIELSQVEQMMGYDNDNENLVIPLIYVYSSISNSIYHVSSTNSNPQGNDNKFCGHLQWPCLTINYAIEQSGSASEK
ncbi:MAG: hypothetical protein EZS28_041525, partial [Streblomastix strix]